MDNEPTSNQDPHEQSRTWALPIASGDELVVESSALGVSIVGIEAGGTPRIEAQSPASHPPRISIAREGDTTNVQIESGGAIPFLGWFGGRRARVTLYVPRSIRVRVATSFGQLKVRDLEDAEVLLTSDAGAITVRRMSGKLDAHTSAGAISVEGFRGTFEVETSAGGIDLGIEALDPGKHRAHTDAGGIKVQVAASVAVRVDTSTDLGGSDVQHPSTASAPASLDLSTHAGGIQVRTMRGTVARTGIRPGAPPDHTSPYRRSAASSDAEMDRVLQMVADGTLSPTDARDLLRALGV